MRKEAISGKTVIKGVIITLLFFLTFIFFVNKTYAGYCQELEETYLFSSQNSCNTQELVKEINLKGQILHQSNERISETTTVFAFGDTLDGVGACGSCNLLKFRDEYAGDPGDDKLGGILSLYTARDIEILEETCPKLDCDYNGSALPGKKGAGSLMGVTKFASNTALEEDIPVNLAYFVKHNAKKIPVVNQTAYAQTGVSYNAFGLEFVLGLWEKTRNIAYAMMSIIMLVVGIMITTQRKINPQTVITVQSALPRIVISLFLITFSYPIGALMVSMVKPLMYMAIGFFVDATVENFANMNFVTTLTTLVVKFLNPANILGLVTGPLIAILTLVAMLIALIKMLFVQLKMLIQIVMAPIQFAISSIPGQEHLVGDWFKGMAVKAVSIPAIMFMISLAWYFPNEFFTNPNTFSGIVTQAGPMVTALSFLRSVKSFTFSTVAIPILQIMTLFAAIKADKTVEGFLLGDKNKKRR